MRTLVLLAGGKSSRMGMDKVFISVNGKTFVETLYEKAAACFDRIIISTDTEEHAEKIRSLPFFACKDPEIVTDLYKDTGPIGGMLSVFEQTDAEKFSIISVDVPKAEMRVLKAVFDKCEGRACFFKIGENRPEPLIAAWSRKAYPQLKKSFEERRFKLRMVLEKGEAEIFTDKEFKKENMEFSETDFEEIFRNFNTQEELEKLYD